MDKLKEHWQSESMMQWHKRQFENPKRNCVYIEKFISKFQKLNGQKVLDLACGGGAEAVYFLKKNPDMEIHGVDYIGDAFDYFNEKMSNEIKSKIKLSVGDWYHLDEGLIGRYDGVISLETLSWMDEWKRPIDAVVNLRPKWMAFSSLFYEGKIHYKIKMEDHEVTQSKDGFDVVNYNIYSIPLIREYLSLQGYPIFHYERFVMDIDLPKPDHMGTGTYTVKTEDGSRLQISAAMMMPWYFIYAAKN